MQAGLQPTEITVRPLAPAIGAEIIGLDLARPIDDAIFSQVHDAFLRHLVLLFRGQSLDAAQHIAFSRRFGELEIHVLSQYHDPAHPEIYVISNVGADGKPRGVHPDKGTMTWHTDTSFTRTPSLATILYGKEVAREGGDTLFANLQAAYDALNAEMKQRIQGLRAVHDLAESRRKSEDAPLTPEQRRAVPSVDHPIVRTHPATGRKGLYLGSHAHWIKDLAPEESDALLAELARHATQDTFVYRHRWRQGDVVMWDNRATVHRATDYDTGRERRVVQRTVVKGNVPF
ncbi:MAG: TauD/TfdA family dioxygenase [Proteobacteria bacterium]|nr:TauD/TfdA family dioxygenase [Pseudomonadota bacterium]